MSTKPYKGLNSYVEEDDILFFGRESQIKNIIERFKASRLTILYGESGVGKTSIVRAGVAAQLRKQAQENLSKYKIPFHAVVVFPPFNLSWKDKPIIQLKQQINRDVCKLIPDIELPKSDLSLTDTLQAWAEQLGGKDVNDEWFSGKLFIIFDQFEEYFLYHPPTVEEGTFDYEFYRAVRRSQLPVHFLISIRKDFIAQLDRYKSRLLNLLNNRLELEHLDYSSAREAIVKPIEEYYNKQVASEETIIIGGKEEKQKEEFIKEILQDLISGNECDKLPGQKRIKAPLLQLVMDHLWQEEINQGSQCLSLQTFEALGKIRGNNRQLGIATLHVNEKLDALSPREQKIIADIFDYLVTPSGSKQAISLTDLVAYAKKNSRRRKDDIYDELKILLKKLAKSQFLILQAIGESTNPSYEIYHDVLAEPLLAWQAEKTKQKKRKIIIFSAAIGIIIACFVVYLNSISRAISKIEGATKQIELAQKDKDFEQDKLQQLRALVRAIRFKDELQEPLKILKWNPWVNTDQYTSAAKKSLKIMLDNIQVKNRLVVENPVLGIRFNSDSQNFAIATSKSSYLWDLKGNKQDLGKFEFEDKVTVAKFNSNGNILAAVFNNTIRLFDLQNDRLKAIPDFQNLPKSTVAISSVSLNSQNTNTLAIGFNNGTVRLENWKEKENQPDKTFDGCQGAIWSMSFSPDGQLLAAGSDDGNVCLWNWEGNQLKILKAHQAAVLSMSFSRPDGQYLATGSANGIVRLWNWKGNQLDRTDKTFGDCQEAIWSMNFSPDGQLLAAGSDDGNVCLWNREGNKPEILKAHQTAVLSTSFSLDGQFLATGSADNTVVLWDLQEKPSLDDESLDWLLNRGCSWIEGYLATNPEEDYIEPIEKEQKLSEQCSNDD